MRSPLKQFIVVAGLVIITAPFVNWAARFMRAEHTIYGWDGIGFWRRAAELAYRPDHSVLGSIAAFGRSMHHDYNDVCTLPSACMMALSGSTSRFCYVISNVVFLVIPAVIVCYWFLIRISLATWAQTASAILAFLALLAVPLPWVVTLTGMTDVGGLIMAAIATDLLIQTDVRSKSALRWLAIGAALGSVALCKRWYLYLVIGLLSVMMVEVALDWIAASRRCRSITPASIGAAAYGPFLCMCSLIAVYFLTFPLPLTIATTDYSYIYSAYQIGDSWLASLETNLVMITRSYGLVHVVFAFLCFVEALFFTQTRRAALYLYVPGWVALVDFSRVQTMTDHHMMLLYIATAVTPLFLAQRLLSADFPQGKPWGWSLLVLAVLISCLSFQSMFSSSPPFGTSVVQKVFPTERIQPIQRHDLAEIEALLRFVGDKVPNPPGQPPVKNVYLLSSSLLFNSSHLSFASFELNEPLPASDKICQTMDVDRRDGFPDELVTAQMVLVADPIQTHLREEQKVLTVPARLFLQGEGFAQAFTRDPQTFQMDEGVRVYAFERVRPSTPEEIAQLHKQIGVASKK